MSSIGKCPICSNIRDLPHHLFELSEYCRYLDNKSNFSRFNSSRIVSTKVIADWLKLAAQLESVEVNAWKFENADAAMFCEPIADEFDSNSKHLSSYSMELVRFTFIANALEELYRFVDRHYDELPISNSKKQEDNQSIRAAALVDRLKPSELPVNYKHIVENLAIKFSRYKIAFNPTMTGMKHVKETNNSYGLHLVRNLRNHIAHGIFPLIDNPEYWGNEKNKINLIHLMRHAGQTAGIFIQALLSKYNHGFQSHDYDYVMNVQDEDGETFFAENCTTELALHLHMQGKFSFEKPEGDRN
ncbi:hypothetical protein [Aeromonas taiwanensis]|uniref:hypothetical protein n=1 Tax=Aeromonas taiwanensis TaxID=633417 RepID=UPI003BA25ACF